MKSPGRLIKAAKAPRAQVMNLLRQWINDGHLTQGVPLPSERDLAQQLHVSRDAVRMGLKMLEAEGLIRSPSPRTRIVAEPTSRRSDGVITNTIAICANKTEPIPEHHQTGWSDFVLLGTMQGIRDAGLHAIILHGDRLAADEVEKLADERPLGVVVLDTARDNLLMIARTLEQCRVPFTVQGNESELVGYDRVVSDHNEGAYLETKWLLNQGRRRILQVASPDPWNYWMRGRRQGYERAIAESGAQSFPILHIPTRRPEGPIDEETLTADARYYAGYLAEFLTSSSPPDALMIPSDGEIQAFARACRMCGKQPNDDVWLAGYDNYWAESRARPLEIVDPIVTVDKLNDVCGRELVRLLIDRVHGRLPQEPQLRIIQPRLLPTPRAVEGGEVI